MITLSNLSTANLKKASSVEAKKPMTETQVKQLSAKLKRENRVNCYPNKFDIKQPIRVVVRDGDEYTTHGYFRDYDVASAIGTLVGIATFGQKALVGDFDPAKAEGHEEYKRWMSDDRNVEVIEAVQSFMAGESEEGEDDLPF